MSVKYAWMDRHTNETKAQYRQRLADAAFVHAGYAYFGANSFDSCLKHYRLTICWNGEFNCKLSSPNPDRGYIIECSTQEARSIYNMGAVCPVYVKLGVLLQQPVCTDIKVLCKNKDYDVKYLGLNEYSIDEAYFPDFFSADYDVELFENTANKKERYDSGFNINKGGLLFLDDNINSIDCIKQTEHIKRLDAGDFNYGSFNIGSFSLGSFNLVSFSIGSFNMGSFNMGSFSIGSFNMGSFSMRSFNLGSFSIGSFNFGSFNLGSYNLGSFNFGSFSDVFFNMKSISTTDDSTSRSNDEENDVMRLRYDIMRDVFGVGLLGYGLDLI